MSSKYAIIDTETNLFDQVMSIGIIIFDDNFVVVDSKYFIVDQISLNGFYTSALFYSLLPLEKEKINQYHDSISKNLNFPKRHIRQEIIKVIKDYFGFHQINHIYAYNATFDFHHLRELQHYKWHCIMKEAAYLQTNRFLRADQHDFLSSGRLKRGYGVESMYRLMSNNWEYHETHNALLDALHELEIMRWLGKKPFDYDCLF